ncbi:UNVERIFIED_CONTAM: putative late blight resistance proteinR1A-10 [Sesamum radiatum]|uniref:Late blight resistance proteinR1A-10 n=1 Tax=Sesamum radiatum TaxID=300843 RepID=A0AAW2PKZ7_SESRA
MAVAAYASLLSLMHVLDNIQNPDRVHRLHVDKERIQSLKEKVKFLVDFFEVYSQRKSQEMEDLASQIAVVAEEVEDIIDLHVVDQLREGSNAESYRQIALLLFCQDINKVIEKIDSITTKLMMVKEEWADVQEPQPVASLPVSSTTLPTASGKNTMVGFDEHLVRVMDELAGGESNLRIFPIAGMGGIARSLSSNNLYLEVSFLDDDKSWKLLCNKVFAQDGCPCPKLETVGKDIVKGCRGLPLAIVVIGGLLAKSNIREEYWRSVAENVTSFANLEDNEHSLKILSLSYNDLPIHLKPCFLYMRVFPEDRLIEVSELIKLWVGEGFLKLDSGKTLEEVANEYLEDLVDRNLILIHKWTCRGKFKVCGFHDLIRDMCLRVFKKEHLVCVPKVQRINLSRRMRNMCFLCSSRASSEESIDVPVLARLPSTSAPSGLMCGACKTMYSDCTGLRLVKVFGQCCRKFPQHTKLRYIDIRAPHFWDRVAQYELDFASPSTIHLLWNLQTLSIDSGTSLEPMALPSEIWEMPQLRHIMVKLAVLPPPADTQDVTVLDNLETLSFIHNFKCTREVLERIRNLKKLKICYSGNLEDWSYYCLYNLAHLHKLESLFFIAKYLLLNKIALPTSLKKLYLSQCRIPWEDMMIFGSLPNLEVLTLNNYAFQGPKWTNVEGQFTRLKFLSICFSDLVRWVADDVPFPVLESLSLEFMNDLEEIPSSIGDIDTLLSIHLNSCKASVVASAKQILEEQHNNGNELQVVVDGGRLQVDDS